MTHPKCSSPVQGDITAQLERIAHALACFSMVFHDCGLKDLYKKIVLLREELLDILDNGSAS